MVNARRAKGLAASAIDICRVTGVGYIECESAGRLAAKQHQERLLTRSGVLAMSEGDLHQLFAEAVVCGQPSGDDVPVSTVNSEIISGLAPITTEQAKEAFRATNAKFSLLIREPGHGANAPADSGAVASVSVRQLLEGVTTLQGVRKVLLGAFKAKLKALMFLAASETVSDTAPLVDLGVDSLVGVEMRSWFLKELGVDVPVMKILGGASTGELVDGVCENLPQELMEWLEAQGDKGSANSVLKALASDPPAAKNDSFQGSPIPPPPPKKKTGWR